ncbi:hypothetical protein L218DRAFT_1009476 [Marasmius fiardii PR-910]|nr:hypothetical protein L218DRAFT_1009476 [Marasmius fiardii PR-910]
MFTEKDLDGNSLPGRKWVGPGVQALVEGPNSTVRDYLGILSCANALLDGKRGTCSKPAKPPGSFRQTETFKYFPQLRVTNENDQHDPKFQVMNEATLLNGDICRLASHVIIHDSHGRSEVGQYFVGQVKEIVCWKNTDEVLDVGLSTPDWFLVETADHRIPSPHYQMPVLSYTGKHMVVKLEDTLGVVNTPHDCTSNACQLTASRIDYQERATTSHTVPQLKHLNPLQRILNLAQMHNSSMLSHFHSPPTGFSSQEQETIIMESALREHRSQLSHSKKSGLRPISQPSTPRLLPAQRSIAHPLTILGHMQHTVAGQSSQDLSTYYSSNYKYYTVENILDT